MNPNVPPTSSIILPPPPTSLTLNNSDVKFLKHETTTLIVKSLPNFPEPDLINFLNHFGPKEIRLGKSKHMKNSAFLDFWDRNSASLAFTRIQDLGDINGKRIRVEYASPSKEILNQQQQQQQQQQSIHDNDIINSQNRPQPQEFQNEHNQPPPLPPLPPPPSIPSSSSVKHAAEPIAPSLGINYPPPPNLYYRYPPPTIESLQNIMNAITTVPKLYTQVLHLMNKMNLPPPFSPVVPDSIPPLLQQQQQQTLPNKHKRKKRDELLSEDESEIDSEEEEEKEKAIQNTKKPRVYNKIQKKWR